MTNPINMAFKRRDGVLVIYKRGYPEPVEHHTGRHSIRIAGSEDKPRIKTIRKTQSKKRK